MFETIKRNTKRQIENDEKKIRVMRKHGFTDGEIVEFYPTLAESIENELHPKDRAYQQSTIQARNAANARVERENKRSTRQSTVGEFCILFDGEPLDLQIKAMIRSLDSVIYDSRRNTIPSMLKAAQRWMDKDKRIKVMIRTLYYLSKLVDDMGEILHLLLFRIVRLRALEDARFPHEVCAVSAAFTKKFGDPFSDPNEELKKQTSGAFETLVCMEYRRISKEWNILKRRVQDFMEYNVGSARDLLVKDSIGLCCLLLTEADDVFQKGIRAYSKYSERSDMLERKCEAARLARKNSPTVVEESMTPGDTSSQTCPPIDNESLTVHLDATKDKNELIMRPPGDLRVPSPETIAEIEGSPKRTTPISKSSVPISKPELIMTPPPGTLPTEDDDDDNNDEEEEKRGTANDGVDEMAICETSTLSVEPPSDLPDFTSDDKVSSTKSDPEPSTRSCLVDSVADNNIDVPLERVRASIFEGDRVSSPDADDENIIRAPASSNESKSISDSSSLLMQTQKDATFLDSFDSSTNATTTTTPKSSELTDIVINKRSDDVDTTDRELKDLVRDYRSVKRNEDVASREDIVPESTDPSIRVSTEALETPSVADTDLSTYGDVESDDSLDADDASVDSLRDDVEGDKDDSARLLSLSVLTTKRKDNPDLKHLREACMRISTLRGMREKKSPSSLTNKGTRSRDEIVDFLQQKGASPSPFEALWARKLIRRG